MTTVPGRSGADGRDVPAHRDRLLLGIDIGTSSSKAVVTDVTGTVVATARRPHAISVPRPGWAEMDPVDCWWREAVDLIAELVAVVGSENVAAVCASGIGPCLAVTDAAFEPLRPALLYGVDMRATAEIEELEARWGRDEILAAGGSALSSQAVGPKLRWLRRHEPRAWADARYFFTASSYVGARLTGHYYLDHHTASQYTPMYDLSAGAWHSQWAGELAEHLPLPPLVWPADEVGTVTASAAQATGLQLGTPVMAGTVDAWAEALSAGVRRPGDLMLMYGTTLFFVQVARADRRHPLLWSTQGLSPGAPTVAAGMTTAGSLVDWCSTVTGCQVEDLDRAAVAVPPGADGLTMLPYFAGERTPIFDPQARGVVAGLTLQHRPEHLLRAAYEGIAFGVRSILDLIDDPDDAVKRIVAVGGGTRSRLWQQVVSDVCDRPQEVPAETIGASYGAALLAGHGAGLVDGDETWARVERTVDPREGAVEAYAALRGGHAELYRQTRELVHRTGGVRL